MYLVIGVSDSNLRVGIIYFLSHSIYCDVIKYDLEIVDFLDILIASAI